MDENRYRLVVTLRQHTPLIHFEYDNDKTNVTLRASEVKPRLNDYIIKQLIQEEFTRLLNKGCLRKTSTDSSINKAREYLDFKMRINGKYEDAILLKGSAKGEQSKNKGLRYITSSSIVGEDKHGIMYSDVEVVFFSFHEEVLNHIKNNIEDFFILHNFGYRQSKGYGSFTVEKIGVESTSCTEEKIIKALKKKDVRFFFKKEPKTNGEISYINAIKLIANDYKLIKSGRNHGDYAKAKIFDYFYPEIRWEKKAIKEKLRKDHPNIWNDLRYNKEECVNRIEGEYPLSKNNKYVRAMLGLAAHMEYTVDEDKYFKYPPNGKVKIKIRDRYGEVTRYQSPIFFKVINNTAYMIPQEVDPKMLNRSFSFYLSVDGNEENEILLLEDIPTPEHFNISEFLLSKDTDIESLTWLKCDIL